MLAITPWEDGVPRFAATGIARTYICAVERRCSVCGRVMAPGPVWRVVSGPEADAIERALAAGREFVNRQATVEAPGHRGCMLYAAVVCPYLARPTARRGEQASLPGVDAGRGDQRGLGGALAGFGEVEYQFSDAMLFQFRGLIEFRRHQPGEEQFAELLAMVDDAPEQDAPEYLGVDESAASRRFEWHRTG